MNRSLNGDINMLNTNASCGSKEIKKINNKLKPEFCSISQRESWSSSTADANMVCTPALSQDSQKEENTPQRVGLVGSRQEANTNIP